MAGLYATHPPFGTVPGTPCPVLDLGGSPGPLPVGHDAQQWGAFFVCYDAHGKPIDGSYDASTLPAVQDPTLAEAALDSRSGSATAVVDTGSPFGRVRLRDTVLFDEPNHPVGVVQFGLQVGDLLNALDILRQRLMIFGALALALIALAGAFLAGRALQPARRAYARQRAFIADASHELRTPLTLLRADAEVLLRGRNQLSPDDVMILEDVVTEASHMASLANSMLDLARLDSDTPNLEQDVLDLSAIAADTGRRVAALAAERHVEVKVEGSDHVLVLGDRVLLEQAILILVDNAIKYNRPSGEVVIRTGAQSDHAFLSVQDSGIGIAAEHLPHLGERFYRVDKARSREAGGAGLGVSIARSIVTRHAGTLRLQSEPGMGTTATITLPRVRQAVPLATSRAEPA